MEYVCYKNNIYSYFQKVVKVKMNRKIVKRLSRNVKDDDDGYIKGNKAELLSMMWEITKDAWSFIRSQDAEQRLQRDVATFTGRKS
jgi:hypothetical protein